MRALGLLLLVGCGGSSANAPPRADLVEGQGIYVLRHNPPPCLADRPELAAELQTPSGWERVALIDHAGERPLVAGLLEGMRGAPGVVRRVRADVTDELRPYGAGHRARVVQVLELDPPESEAR